MSHHIANNDPKKPCKPDIPLVGKHNITPKDLEHGGCGCHQQDLSPSRLDQVIEQYEAMKEEAAAARDEFVQKARGLDDIAHETRATSNRNAILNAIGNLNFSKPFAEKVGNSIVFHDVTPRQLAQLTRIIGKKVPSLETSELYFFIVTDPNDEERRNLKVGAYGIEFTETAFSFANGDDGLVVSKIEVDLPGEEYGWEFVGVSYFGYDDIISDGDLSWRIADLRQWIDEEIELRMAVIAKEAAATANKEAIIAAMSGISVDTSNLATKAVEQWLGLEESYEAEAKGGERTNNTVIDECKVRFQDAFNGLLPTGFTMPNSVTIDNLTYTGTTNS